MTVNKMGKEIVYSGIGMGSALAMILSFDKWHSILWAILHGIFGWFYVIYYVLTYGGLI